jgi:hypothetical protein
MLFRRAYQAILSKEQQKHISSSLSSLSSRSILSRGTSFCFVDYQHHGTGRRSLVADATPIASAFRTSTCTSTSVFSNYPSDHGSWKNYAIRSFSSTHDATKEESASASSSASAKDSTNTESLEFQAETRQLLDIVTHSLYTDKEVFLRELISNASDALEKLRHLRNVNQEFQCEDAELPLEIRIETDELNGTISITDTGIGMNRQDMIDHLGTIARSGSKAFMNDCFSDFSKVSERIIFHCVVEIF